LSYFGRKFVNVALEIVDIASKIDPIASKIGVCIPKITDFAALISDPSAPQARSFRIRNPMTTPPPRPKSGVKIGCNIETIIAV
jgi:hypothetical protein